jgi:hypothetical protein
VDPDPSIFIIDLQDANKKLMKKKSFSAYYFLKVLLRHFSKIKSQKEVTMIEGSGSGSGSRRPKNMWIRIRNTDFYSSDEWISSISKYGTITESYVEPIFGFSPAF